MYLQVARIPFFFFFKKDIVPLPHTSNSDSFSPHLKYPARVQYIPFSIWFVQVRIQIKSTLCIFSKYVFLFFFLICNSFFFLFSLLFIYLLKKLDRLPQKILHFTDFADCIPEMVSDMLSLVPCIFWQFNLEAWLYSGTFNSCVMYFLLYHIRKY